MKTYNIVLTLSERSEIVIFMIPVMVGFGMGSSSSRWYQGLQNSTWLSVTGIWTIIRSR